MQHVKILRSRLEKGYDGYGYEKQSYHKKNSSEGLCVKIKSRGKGGKLRGGYLTATTLYEVLVRCY